KPPSARAMSAATEGFSAMINRFSMARGFYGKENAAWTPEWRMADEKERTMIRTKTCKCKREMCNSKKARRAKHLRPEASAPADTCRPASARRVLRFRVE